MVAEEGLFAVEILLVAFAGGAIGASIGGTAALSLAGVTIVAGEAGHFLSDPTAGGPAATQITGLIGYGPALGPHVAFAGGVAAAAYLGREEASPEWFPYHRAKNVYDAIGARPDALLAGGSVGILGYWIATLTHLVGAPVDPVMFSVVVTGVVSRIAFGYPIVGSLGEDVLSTSGFEAAKERWLHPKGESGKRTAETRQECIDRPGGEPWAPQQFRWEQQALVGLVVGLFAASVARVTASYYLAFGIASASLLFLVAGHRQFPITHHAALPASIAALSVPGAGPVLALLVGTGFGITSALVAELASRLVYAHADTHLDPPAIAIVVTTFAISVLTTVGTFQQDLIPAL